MARRLTIRRRVARWAWRGTRRKVGDVRRWWRTAGGGKGGPTPYGHALRQQTSTRNHTGGERPPGHYSRPRPAGKVQPMTSRLSGRALAMLPPECQQITRGAEGVGAWEPDSDTPATDTQHRLAAVGLTLSRVASALSDMLETMARADVDRKVLNPFGGAVDNVTSAAEGVEAVARKFAELYGKHMDAEDETVKPLRVPAGRRVAA